MTAEETMYTLTYMDRRGAGILKMVTAGEAKRLLPRIKAKATLRDGRGDVVGGVEDWADRLDDRRLKWIWWSSL